MEKKKMQKMGVRAMERLDLPLTIAPGIPTMELVGPHQFFMTAHRGVISYSAEQVEISGGELTVRLTGRELVLAAMTAEEVRIEGNIERLELIG